MSTIPASEIVNVEPSVIGVGGSALDLVGLFLTTNPQVPLGDVASFPDAASVEDYFGATSVEADAASKYFLGFNNSNKKPANLLITQYNQNPVSAYLRGAAISGISLATLQTYSGALGVTIDGVLHTANVNLSSVTSFSNAAASIAAALNIKGVQEASFTGSMGAAFTATGTGTQLTVSGLSSGVIHAGDLLSGGTAVPANTTIVNQVSGTIGGNGVYTTSNPTTLAAAAANTSSTTIDVTALSSGTLTANLVLTGTGVTANTYLTGLITGTGGTGTYLTGTQQRFLSQAITAYVPGVLYDSVSGAMVINSGMTGASSTITFGTGALATSLLLTATSGGTLSQGSDVATPSAFMAGVVATTMNWATFTTLFDPDSGSGNTQKLAFAAWNTAQNNRFMYVDWDTDTTPTTTLPATASQGYILTNNGNSGTFLQWAPDNTSGIEKAAFICGLTASIDFTEQNGRTSFAMRQQAGLEADVSNAIVANNLAGSPQTSNRGNGYSFYGAYGAAAENFIWEQRGFVTGDFAWADSYVNQIQLNNAFQLALLTFLQNSKSVPYSIPGAAAIEQALADPIAAGLNFGTFGPGAISSSQIAAVNAQAGANIAPALQAQGYYLQVLQAASTTRVARTSPPCKFWYLDRGSVQAINLQSISVP